MKNKIEDLRNHLFVAIESSWTQKDQWKSNGPKRLPRLLRS